MKKLKLFIDSLEIDKLRHRVLGQYINPFIFILVAILITITIYFVKLNFLKWLISPIGLIFCWLFHHQIEVWQRKTNSGKFEIADAKAGFSSAIKIAILIVIIQLLNLF